MVVVIVVVIVISCHIVILQAVLVVMWVEALRVFSEQVSRLQELLDLGQVKLNRCTAELQAQKAYKRYQKILI